MSSKQPHPDHEYYFAGLVKGNEKVIGQIYNEFASEVKKHVMYNSGNIADAKDLFQHCLLTIRRQAMDGYVLTSSFGTFFRRVYKTRWLNQLKRASRIAGISDEKTELEESSQDVFIEKEQLENFKEQRQLVQVVMVTLRKSHQRYLKRYWELLEELGTEKQISGKELKSMVNKTLAKEFDCTEGYIRKTISKARAELIEKVKAYYAKIEPGVAIIRGKHIVSKLYAHKQQLELRDSKKCLLASLFACLFAAVICGHHNWNSIDHFLRARVTFLSTHFRGIKVGIASSYYQNILAVFTPHFLSEKLISIGRSALKNVVVWPNEKQLAFGVENDDGIVEKSLKQMIAGLEFKNSIVCINSRDQHPSIITEIAKRKIPLLVELDDVRDGLYKTAAGLFADIREKEYSSPSYEEGRVYRIGYALAVEDYISKNKRGILKGWDFLKSEEKESRSLIFIETVTARSSEGRYYVSNINVKGSGISKLNRIVDMEWGSELLWSVNLIFHDQISQIFNEEINRNRLYLNLSADAILNRSKSSDKSLHVMRQRANEDESYLLGLLELNKNS